MRRFLQWADAVLLRFVVLLSAVFLLCVILQVLFRYVLEEPLVWSEELARYCFIWSSLLTASIIVGRNDHFNIPIIVDRLSPRGKTIAEALAIVLSIVFALIVLDKGTEWSWRMRNASSPVMQLPQGMVYAIVPLSALYMIMHLATRLGSIMDRRRTRDQEPC